MKTILLTYFLHSREVLALWTPPDSWFTFGCLLPPHFTSDQLNPSISMLGVAKGLVTNYGGGGGGACEVLTLRKGGGAQKVLAMLKGGGAQQVLG